MNAQPVLSLGFFSAFLTIWIFMSYPCSLIGCQTGSAQVLDGDVDQPGAQRSLFLVRFLAFVLHGVSLN
jgi:hypothetical protein